MENSANKAIQEAGTVEDLIRLVMRLHKQRTVVAFGVTKREGVSLQRERRTANDNAVSLLNSLPAGFDGKKLTDEKAPDSGRVQRRGRSGGWRRQSVRILHPAVYGGGNM